ncbi:MULTISPECIES: hypothetical protein [unclassified Modicisalibacter]|uniref:hypothetical protein n=1 Tax=unclassified Modicisalibacter TaxID=2679913 RepID=UPI001CCCDC13|nr:MULTISPECIES: hypothetical protein [unclassified Modicisalibacter]MBZ9559472.1 hypothetical protein [Modicisalibacter sp. R2A 31.J]MBZ9576362.1 hypothetical protein [Modicisalibacter sp. MOD 31.J]
MSETSPDGQTTTRLCAVGQDATHEPADQLFYLVDKSTLLAVPKAAMQNLLTEMRHLEGVVEAQQIAVADLKAAQEEYIHVMQGDGIDPEARARRETADSPEELARQVRLAQVALDKANKALRETINPLTPLNDDTNHIQEMIPLQRRGAPCSQVGFRLAYARSQALDDAWPRYRPASAPTDNADGLLSGGRIDWDTLKRQLDAINSDTRIKQDVPWFEDWLKLEDQDKELFQWSARLNEDLDATSSHQSGGDHEAGSVKVDLSGEAQLMRWSYGASGLAGDADPLAREGNIKASGHAALTLAQAKGSIECYEPPGGYMMAFAGMNLGMLRSHTFLNVAGGVGASVAAELNLDVQFNGDGARARGIEGSTSDNGLPGGKVIDMATPEAEQGTELKAFAGGELEVTVGGQIEWKNPEVDEFAPFAKIVPALGAQIGAGAEATLIISYQGGKFQIKAKAAFCYGVGAKGSLALEVDGDLIVEFVLWVAYQLKNIDYSRLEFIDEQAFEALSNIVALALESGKELKKFMLDSTRAIENYAQDTWYQIESGVEAADRRARLAGRINADPDLLKYTSPDTKGQLIHQLIQTNAADIVDPRGQEWNPLDSAFWKAGVLTTRKEAIIRIFTWVQSQAEFDNIMQRVIPTIGGPTIGTEEGKRRVQAFLDMGEVDWPVVSFFYTDFDGNLQRFYEHLRPTASKGTPIVANDMTEYLSQSDIAPSFDRPCFNETQCHVDSTTRTA